MPGPVLTLKANNQHPAGRVVYDGWSVLLRLDVSPAGWTTPLDWYFAIKADNGSVYLRGLSGFQYHRGVHARPRVVHIEI